MDRSTRTWDRDTLTFCLLLSAAVVALAVLITMTVSGRPGSGDTPLTAPSPMEFESPPVAPLRPPPPALAQPVATASPTPTPVQVQTEVEEIPVRQPSTSRPAARPTPPRATTRPPAGRPAAPGWSAWLDRPVSLEVAGSPGLLVRHRDFVAQLGRISGRNSALARADSTFVLRRGLADDGCLSFESVNYAGRYLRHQNFVVRLHRRDGSALFARDATFCPEAAGEDLTLRSVNYPDHRLAVHRSTLTIGPVSRANALRLHLRPPP